MDIVTMHVFKDTIVFLIVFVKKLNARRSINIADSVAIAIIDVDLNYLRNEGDEFITKASQRYGYRGAKQAEELVTEIGGLFAGGELSESDKDAVMQALQQAYWDAKKENKKYTPKKYRKDSD